MSGRLAVIIVMSCALAGCLSDRREKIAGCQLDAERSIGRAADNSAPFSRQMSLCMMGAGYQFSFKHAKCQPSETDPPMINAFCYVPTGGPAYSRFWLESLFGN